MQNLMPGATFGSDSAVTQGGRVRVSYRVRSEAGSIEARARSIAIEQSVELPLEAIQDDFVQREIVGEVLEIADRGNGLFEVAIGLAAATMPPEAGQLFNMLFGNTSLHDDVTLHGVDFPAGYADRFGGPNAGLAGLRELVRADKRAMTATALKPQGLAPAAMAKIAGAAALGGIDIIKDDHGLADQDYCPFAARVGACADAVARANRATGRSSVYAPSLSGNLDQLREQIDIGRRAGVRVALIAPMVVGLPSFHAITSEAPDFAFLAHPSLAGACRIAPAFLLGRIFRMLGADATIFPNHGGRFSYSPETCLAIATAARERRSGMRPCAPTPAGGMTMERVGEMLDFYGRDSILLIGGSLLSSRENITSAARLFAAKVDDHGR